ncbi:MAG: universal stress protein [Oxalobacteraceae bacterium]|nr:universal stress protein [Oxalobacteraceae bacterium]
MTYKSILVHVDQTAQARERIRLAAAIAENMQAHLIGTAMTGVSHLVFEQGSFNQHDPIFDHHLKNLRAYARQSLDTFDTLIKETRLSSVESRLMEDDAVGGMTLQARYADLLVIGQFDPVSRVPGVMSDFPESVVTNCVRPVLIMPHTRKFTALPTKIAVAWDGSMTATRALVSALPLLKQSSQTDLIIFNPTVNPDKHGQEPGADVALYLSRHGVKVTIISRDTRSSEAEALLSYCSDQAMELVVMGGYGHTRFREMVLGGATREMLLSMTVPVLMAH